MDLKNTLKVLKLNEPTISTVLGALIILIIGVGLVNYLKGRTTPTPATLPGSQTSQEEKISLPQTHKVEKGEDLWKISEKYYKSGYNWMDIAQVNNLKQPNFLAVGQEITIPDVQARTTTKVNTATKNEQAQPNAPNNTKFGDSINGDSYTVVKGDHLWGIAVRAYGDGFRWTELVKTNTIKHPNLIFPGQKLTIPSKS